MNTKITKEQAQLLLDWMAMAATDAAQDQEEGESWRIHRFQHQSQMLMEQFNEAAENAKLRTALQEIITQAAPKEDDTLADAQRQRYSAWAVEIARKALSA